MREIKLTRGMCVLVDDEDFESLSASRWRIHTGTSKAGGVYFYAATGRHPNSVLMHREIVKASRAQYVDHWNGDGLDNRRSNLRVCSGSQNNANRRVIRSKTGFKGVHTEGKRWEARIKINRKTIHIGKFDSPEEAAHAYDRAAIKLFGKFAATNAMLGALPK